MTGGGGWGGAFRGSVVRRGGAGDRNNFVAVQDRHFLLTTLTECFHEHGARTGTDGGRGRLATAAAGCWEGVGDQDGWVSRRGGNEDRGKVDLSKIEGNCIKRTQLRVGFSYVYVLRT